MSTYRYEVYASINRRIEVIYGGAAAVVVNVNVNVSVECECEC